MRLTATYRSPGFLLDELVLSQRTKLKEIVLAEQPGLGQAHGAPADERARRRRKRRGGLQCSNRLRAELARVLRRAEHGRLLEAAVRSHGQFEHDDGFQRVRRATGEDTLPVRRLDVLRQSTAPLRFGRV